MPQSVHLPGRISTGLSRPALMQDAQNRYRVDSYTVTDQVRKAIHHAFTYVGAVSLAIQHWLHVNFFNLIVDSVYCRIGNLRARVFQMSGFNIP